MSSQRNILLTCFGGALSWDFLEDFRARGDYRLFLGDAAVPSRAAAFTSDLLCLLPGDHPDFCTDLLEQALRNGIGMIIPGADEEAQALMPQREAFARAGIIVAVQPEAYAPMLASKSAMYAFLSSRGFPVPPYKVAHDRSSLEAALEAMGYPGRPLVVKPDRGRGGRGVFLLTEKPVPNKDGLNIIDRTLFCQIIDGCDHIVMENLDSVMYDIDVLRYADGNVFFGARRRMQNVSKVFHGNIFDGSAEIYAFARRLFDAFPTEFLIDYDIALTRDGRIELIEVNPRPSGSTVSYLPFGVNLYHALARSYLDQAHDQPGRDFEGRTAYAFHHMLAIGKSGG